MKMVSGRLFLLNSFYVLFKATEKTTGNFLVAKLHSFPNPSKEVARKGDLVFRVFRLFITRPTVPLNS